MKTILWLICCAFSVISFAKGDLVLIGGGAIPPAILIKMMSLRKDAPILLIPLAGKNPKMQVLVVKTEFSKLNFKQLEVFQCESGSMDTEACLSQIKKAGLIFFTGGDQNRLLRLFQNTQALALIKKRYEKDLPLAGTSAGAVIMSQFMITGNKHLQSNGSDNRARGVETKKGFGLFKNSIIDSHFYKRNRVSRLMRAVLDHPGVMGLGIDESTAILAHANEFFEVLGEGAVMVIDHRQSRDKNNKVQILLLRAGDFLRF